MSKDYKMIAGWQAHRLTEDGLVKVASRGSTWDKESAPERHTEAEAVEDCDTYGGNIVLRVVWRQWL